MAWTLQNEWNTFDRRTHTQLSARVQGKFFIAINRFVCSSWRIFFFFFVAACCDSCETVYFHFFFFILNVYIWNSEWITHEKKIWSWHTCNAHTHSILQTCRIVLIVNREREHVTLAGFCECTQITWIVLFLSFPLYLSISLYHSLSHLRSWENGASALFTRYKNS